MSNQRSYMLTQQGGGRCSLCGSPSTTKVSCPLNASAKNKDNAKHPLAFATTPPHTPPKQKPSAPVMKSQPPVQPKPSSMNNMPEFAAYLHNPDYFKPSSPKAKKPTVRKAVKSSASGSRMSAGHYYAKHGESSIGDVCDIRGNGELKCLLLDVNGRPSWALPAKQSTRQAPCGNWAKKCKTTLAQQGGYWW